MGLLCVLTASTVPLACGSSGTSGNPSQGGAGGSLTAGGAGGNTGANGGTAGLSTGGGAAGSSAAGSSGSTATAGAAGSGISGSSATGGEAGLSGTGGVAGENGAVGAAGSASISDPGLVACGSDACDSSTSYCCSKTSDPPSQTCILKSSGYAACFTMGGDGFGCDEPSDCAMGENCVIATNAPMTTTCSDSLGGPRLCKQDGDCEAGTGPCVTQTCNTAFGKPEVVSTCGGSTWCTAHP
ncbi:MAG TPA: hypothetical protein VGP93_06880 [Polyangiaceae bacterium]|nr:hypothetical protein [Polyangiaceae bacterium]